MFGLVWIIGIIVLMLLARITGFRIEDGYTTTLLIFSWPVTFSIGGGLLCLALPLFLVLFFSYLLPDNEK